jgi:hypothetical protein
MDTGAEAPIAGNLRSRRRGRLRFFTRRPFYVSKNSPPDSDVGAGARKSCKPPLSAAELPVFSRFGWFQADTKRAPETTRDEDGRHSCSSTGLAIYAPGLPTAPGGALSPCERAALRLTLPAAAVPAPGRSVLGGRPAGRAVATRTGHISQTPGRPWYSPHSLPPRTARAGRLIMSRHSLATTFCLTSYSTKECGTGSAW